MSEVTITIKAEDLSGPQLEALAKNLNVVERSGQSAQRGIDVFAQSVGRTAQEVEHAMGMMTRLDLVQITLDQSTDRVRNAQENLNDAVAKYGPSSTQAAAATRELTRAQQDADKAHLRAELSLGLVVAQSVEMAAKMPAAVAELYALAAGESAAASAGAVLENVLTVGIASVAIVTGILAVKQAMDGLGDSADNAADNISGMERSMDVVWQKQRVEQARKEWEDAASAVDDFYQKFDDGLKMTQADEQQAEALESRRVDTLNRLNSEVSTLNWLQQVDQAKKDYAAHLEDLDGRAKNLASSLNLASLSMMSLRDMAGMSAEPIGTLEHAMGDLAQTQVNDTLAETNDLEVILGQVSGPTRDELLKQAAAVTDKNGQHTILNKLLADGVISEEDYAKYTQASGEAAGAAATEIQRLNDARAAAPASSGAAAEPTPGSSRGLRQFLSDHDLTPEEFNRWSGTTLATPRGGYDWAGMSRAASRAAGLDISGVNQTDYAPFGKAFGSGGALGATDIPGVYGSRVNLNGQASGSAQGGGTVNVGGVTVIVQSGPNAADIGQAAANGVQRAVRVGSRRNF